MEPQPPDRLPPSAPIQTDTPVHPRPQPASIPPRLAISFILILLLISAALLVYLPLNTRLSDQQKELNSLKTAAKQAYPTNTIDPNRYQAVFLNSGQVYFGKVTSMKDGYVTLVDIFYLQNGGKDIQDTSASSANVSLVKLGCELHKPDDKMVINLNEITFWENLSSDGQVSKAIDTFKKENPNGQECTT